MKLHGLLSWYDEPPSALAACIAGLHTAGIDHLIALDGAYALFPDAKAASPTDQAQTIHATCEALGIGCTIHTPATAWHGNEVQKRTTMFQVAHALSDPGDWWIVMDADQVVTDAPSDLKQQLEHTDHDVAMVTFWERRNLDEAQEQARQFNWARENQWTIRIMFRAQPIHCDTNHYTYVTQDGRTLWCSDSSRQEPCLDLRDLKVEHRHHQRPIDRKQAKANYYTRRDTLGIERGQCDWHDCDLKGTQHVARNFRPSNNRDGYVADLVEACPKHAKRIEHENRWQLRQWGVDLDTVTPELRDGAAA